MEPEKDSASPPRNSWWPLALLGTLFALLSLRKLPTQSSKDAIKPMHPQETPANSSKQMNPPILSNMPPATHQQCYPYPSKDNTPSWKKWIEITVGISTAGLLLINIFLLRATQNTVDKSREANEINRQALYTVQRAFIIQTKPTTELARYDVINGVRQKRPVRMIEFTHHWENVGNTPAIGVVTGVGKVVQADEITEDEFMLYGHVDQTTAKAGLGPRATFDSGTLIDDETFLTDSPESPRFMWGWIVYRDTFPNTKAHVTEFCWKITQIAWKLDDKGKRIEEKPHLTASACARHNCVDEFCEDYADITKLSPTHQ